MATSLKAQLGGNFIPTFFSGSNGAAILTNSNSITITPPSGQAVALVNFGIGSGTETGTQTVSGSISGAVISGRLAVQPRDASEFNIGGSSSSFDSTLPQLIFKTDEVVTLTSDVTLYNAYYSYAYGRLS